MLSLVSILLTLTCTTVWGQGGVRPYVGSDGRLYYNKPIYCSAYSRSLLFPASYVDRTRSAYIAIDDMDCCYLADTRSDCCVSAEGECKCSPGIMCGNPVTVAPSTPPPSPNITATAAPRSASPTNATTTTTTAVPTTKMANTTTEMPTTTTKMMNTTIKTANATTEEPTQSTSSPDTTTITTMTTTPFVSLCSLGFRILNGNPVDDQCTFSGVVSITVSAGSASSCNAVLTTANVSGTVKQTFVTAAFCKEFIDAVSRDVVEIQIGTRRFPVVPPLFSIIDGPNGLAYIDPDARYVNPESELGCQPSTCSYNANTMSGLVNFTDCKIVSWGVSNASNTEATNGGLKEAAVAFNPGGCADVNESFGAANTLCFKTVSDLNLFCFGDAGAPVYCRAPANDEWILLGVTALQPRCDASNEVRVIPLSEETATELAKTFTEMPSTTTEIPNTTTEMVNATTETTNATAEEPAQSTSPPDTTAITTMTTTPFVSLCSLEFRVLHGNQVEDQCTFSGIANITILDGITSTCNAVLASANVNGTVKQTFVTTALCKNIIDSVLQQNYTVEIQIGTLRFPITPPLFRVITGPNGVAFIDPSGRYVNLLDNLGCQQTACAYNADTMTGLVDFNDCKIASWGVSDATKRTFNGLNEAGLAINPFGCADVPETMGAANTLCFKTVSGLNLFCAGDSGAPVYCRSPSNGEWILLGVAAWQARCNDDNEVRVIPLPS